MSKAERSIRIIPPSVCSGLLAAYFVLTPAMAAAQGVHADPAAMVDLGLPAMTFGCACVLVWRNRRMSWLLAGMRA
jgi:hypothetical protein